MIFILAGTVNLVVPTAYNSNPVQGSSAGSGQGQLTNFDGAGTGNVLLQWGGDNTMDTGNEAVLLNLKANCLRLPLSFDDHRSFTGLLVQHAI